MRNKNQVWWNESHRHPLGGDDTRSRGEAATGKRHRWRRSHKLPRAAGRQAGGGQDPAAQESEQVHAARSCHLADLNRVTVTCSLVWLPCFYGGNGFPFTVLIIICPFKINVSGHGESIQGGDTDMAKVMEMIQGCR